VCDVFDEQERPIAGPVRPDLEVLGEAEVMDEVERPRSRPGQPLELFRVRLERVADVVEEALEAQPGQRLDLGAAVVCRHEDLVSRLELEGLEAVPEPMPGQGEQAAAGRVEGKRKRVPRPA